METIIKDIRYGIRGLIKRPGFTTVAVLTLALGIGANSAIFSVLNAVLLRPLPYADADRIVRIDETEGKGGMGVSPPNLLDFQQQNQTFESVAGYTGGSFILTGVGEPLRVQSCAISAELFSVLGVKPLIGRSFLTEDERPEQDRVALISYGLWQSRFGGDHALLHHQIYPRRPELHGRRCNAKWFRVSHSTRASRDLDSTRATGRSGPTERRSLSRRHWPNQDRRFAGPGTRRS